MHSQVNNVARLQFPNLGNYLSFRHAVCIPGSMMVELEERVCELESWTEGKGLIVRGATGTFCSGSDLNAVRAISNPQVLTIQYLISWFSVYWIVKSFSE